MTMTEASEGTFFYCYTVFDGDPKSSGDVAWHDRTAVEVRAKTPEDVLEMAFKESIEDALELGFYEEQRIWVTVWDEEDTIVAEDNRLVAPPKETS
jgi:hypothetical protein